MLACSYRHIGIELLLTTEIRYHWMFVPVQDRKLSLTGTLSQTRRLEDLTLEQDTSTTCGQHPGPIPSKDSRD